VPAGLPAQTIPGRSRPILFGRIDAFATTREIQRGIRRNADPVGELDAIIGVQRGRVALTVGSWGMFEPGDTRDEPRADLRAGTAGLSNASGWVQLTARLGRTFQEPADTVDPGAGRDRSAGRVVVAGGIVRQWYRRVGGDPAVTEVYGTARLDAGSWMPALAAWQAVRGAEGLYLEPSLSYLLRGSPFTRLDFLAMATVRAGVQIGSRDPDGGPKVPGPEGTGLTHLAAGVSLRESFWLRHPVALVLATRLEGQINRDPATKLRRDGTSKGWFRLWFPIQLGLSVPLGGAQ
jgi:hypothetical protein